MNIVGSETPDMGQVEGLDNTSEEQFIEHSYEYIDPSAFEGKYVKIKVDGEEVEVPFNEALQGYQRQADYTRKTQEIASQREKLQYAQTLQEALESNPQQTIELLSRHYNVPAANQIATEHNVPSTPEFDDPLEEKIWYMDQKIAAFEKQQADHELQKEIGRLQSKYDDFNPMEVVRAAIQYGTNDLEGVYKQIAFDRLVQSRNEAMNIVNQQKNQITDSKRDASFVHSGGSANAPTTTPVGKVGSVAEAWNLAKRQMNMN